jgi:group I intron endonuclease
MKTNTQGVYGITLLLDGRVYVGSSVQCEKRLQYHQRNLRRGTHDNPYLQKAWNKYGENEFVCGILEKVEDKIWLRAREQAWISRTAASQFNISCAWTPSDDKNPEILRRQKESLARFYTDSANRERQSAITKQAMTSSTVKKAVSEAQLARFSDPVKKAAFKQAHNTEETRNRHAESTRQWQKIHPLKHSEEWKQGQSKRSHHWHADPANAEKRRLRAERISQSKKGIDTAAHRKRGANGRYS